MDADDSLDIKVTAGLETIPCYKRNMGKGLFIISFKPMIPLPHRVHVLCHGYNAKGCPFDLIIADSGTHSKDTVATGPGLYMARCSRSAGFTILTKGSSGRDFDVVVSGPGGVAVPVRCYQQRDGNLRAEFSPNLPGGKWRVITNHRTYLCNLLYILNLFQIMK